MSSTHEGLTLPESQFKHGLQQQQLRQSWQEHEKGHFGQTTSQNGWRKQTLTTFRQSLDNKKDVLEKYLSKSSNYKKLSCLTKRPSQYMFQPEPEQSNSPIANQHSGTITNTQLGGSKGGMWSDNLTPVNEKVPTNFNNGIPNDSQLSIGEVTLGQESREIPQRDQIKIKIQAYNIAKRQKRQTRITKQLYQSQERQKLTDQGVIFVQPVTRLFSPQSLKHQEPDSQVSTNNQGQTQGPQPLKKFSFKFQKEDQSQIKPINDKKLSQLSESFDLSRKVTKINLLKQKTSLTVEEIFRLKGVTKQPIFWSDEYLLEKFRLETEAALTKPESIEDNNYEIDRISQRMQLTTKQINDLAQRKKMDYGFIPSRVFSTVPQAKQEQEILDEVNQMYQRIQKQERYVIKQDKYDPMAPPDQTKMNQFHQELYQNKIQQATNVMAKGQQNLVARIEIQDAKTQFNSQAPQTGVEKYVEDTLSHAKDHIKKTNIMRTTAIVGLKKSLFQNVEEELHREEQKQMVRDLIKSRDIFGVGFEEFQLMLKEDAKEIIKVTKTLSETTKFIEMFKASQGAKLLELNPTDPKFQFLRSCRVDLNLCLPILDKLFNKKLALCGYQLSEGHCRALANVFRFLDGQINGILIQNCGITDKQLAAILSGATLLNGFRSIVLKQNQISFSTLEAMRPILQKMKPNQLTELKLVDCKLAAKITHELIMEMQLKCSLEKLTLVGCKITSTTFTALIEVIEYGSELRQLDLSWCEVPSTDFLNFFTMLSQNRRLTHLNISGNKLFDSRLSEEGELNKDCANGVANLSTFIRKNQSLIHLDMQHAEMSAEIIELLVKAINESPSLMAVHLCGNPGISPDLISSIQQQLGSQDPFKAENYIQGFSKAGEGELNSYTVQDTLHLKSILQNKKLQELKHDVDTGDYQRLHLERQLSLSHLIPHSQVWRINTYEHRSCFICDQHIIGVVFWSKELQAMQTNPVSRSTESYYSNKTQSIFDRSDSSKQQLPTFQASCTNWEPVPLKELSELCLQINGTTEPDWVEYLSSRDKLRPHVTSYEEMNEKEMKKVRKRRLEFRQQCLYEWPRTLIDGLLPYKKVQLVNGKELADAITSKSIDLIKNPIYCGIFFMKAGRQHFVVRQQGKAFVLKDIVKFREEEVTQ